VAGAVGQRAGLAIAREAGIDQPGVVAGQVGRAQAHAFHDAGAVRLEHHVGLLAQPPRHGQADRRLEVQANGPLAPAPGREQPSPLPTAAAMDPPMHAVDRERRRLVNADYGCAEI
jgi:hypothetical protein